MDSGVWNSMKVQDLLPNDYRVEEYPMYTLESEIGSSCAISTENNAVLAEPYSPDNGGHQSALDDAVVIGGRNDMVAHEEPMDLEEPANVPEDGQVLPLSEQIGSVRVNGLAANIQKDGVRKSRQKRVKDAVKTYTQLNRNELRVLESIMAGNLIWDNFDGEHIEEYVKWMKLDHQLGKRIEIERGFMRNFFLRLLQEHYKTASSEATLSKFDTQSKIDQAFDGKMTKARWEQILHTKSQLMLQYYSLHDEKHKLKIVNHYVASLRRDEKEEPKKYLEPRAKRNSTNKKKSDLISSKRNTRLTTTSEKYSEELLSCFEQYEEGNSQRRRNLDLVAEALEFCCIKL
ncbi:hypothetical protein HDE_09721 [Halotydeus destructor]|nr:hypothetical protein HDE_09721 [Halotydeus destructor]